jgi:hypothetical protein
MTKNIPNDQKIPNDHKSIPNGSKIEEMSIKFTNIFYCKTLQNLPKLAFWVWKNTYRLATLIGISASGLVWKAAARIIVFADDSSRWQDLFAHAANNSPGGQCYEATRICCRKKTSNCGCYSFLGRRWLKSYIHMQSMQFIFLKYLNTMMKWQPENLTCRWNSDWQETVFYIAESFLVS